MPSVLHITDKPSPGGGVRSIVNLYQKLAAEHGWQSGLFRLVHRSDTCGHDRDWAPVNMSRWKRATKPPGMALNKALLSVDVVHLHLGFSAIDANFVNAIAARLPLVVSLHDISPFLHQKSFAQREEHSHAGSLALLKQRYLRPTRRRLWNALCMQADAILVPSEYLGKLTSEFGATERKIHVIHHPVSAQVIRPLAPSKSRPVIVFAGSLIRPKGVSVLLNAFSMLGLDQAELVFVGDGELRRELEAQTIRLHCADRVHFRGQVSELDVQNDMAKARIVAHPSLVAEGFGLTGIEAMCLGRPVVGFGLGGTKDWLIDGKTGLIAHNSDAEGLAASMLRLLSDDALADRLGEAARDFVIKKFDRQMISNRLISVYRDAQKVAK